MISVLRNRKHIHALKVTERHKFFATTFRSSSSSSNDEDDYEFIQKSKVPTMHFQPSLLRLPIPRLEDSCRRYLKAQEPISTEAEHQNTSDIVADFLKNDGPRLHQELRAQDAENKHTSYISEPWFDMYLRDRKPLPINYNPLLVFNQETDSAYNKPLIKSTNLIISAARFMKSLQAGLLEPEIFHLGSNNMDGKLFQTFVRFLPSRIASYGAYLVRAIPLDMSQYPSLFGTARIPQNGKDVLKRHTLSHIVVMRRGYFYTMDLLDSRGNIRKPLEIASGLSTILSDTRGQNQYPVGAFTTMNRDDWAQVREHLVQLGNAEVLEKIDSAAFVFIFDEDPVEADKNKLIRLFLHGDGTNRWFDKSISLIISGDGVAGINFEHSWGDGVAVLRFLKELKKDVTEKPRFHPGDELSVSTDESSIQRLDFVVDDNIKESVEKSLQYYKDWTKNRLSVDHLISEGFGKNECKKSGVSPDAVMQLALQLAVFKRDRRAVATYESCSTAAFRHGRTETLRSCTSATKALCEAICGISGLVRDEQLRKMLIACSEAHNTLSKEAAIGQGFDRHFFALKTLHEKTQGGDLPAIFQDPAYKNINQNVLSTSTLSSPEIMAGGFGPVIERGYGVGYVILDHMVGSVVTSYRQHRDASEYVGFLKSSLDDIQRILGNK